MANILKELKRITNDPYADEKNVLIIKRFLVRLKEYWYIYDLDHGTILSEIFEALYIKPGKMTYDEITENLFVTKSTLDRYVIKFNRLAKIIIEKDYKYIKNIITPFLF